MPELTQDELKDALLYFPKTGAFLRRPSGKRAGSVNKKGYWVIGIKQKLYQAHRLAFLYMTGKFPDQEVDHRNHDKSDNRWDNLRDVSGSKNARNAKLSVKNKSGYTGVYATESGDWVAKISDGKKVQTIGIFDSKMDAALARRFAEQRLGYHPNHGRSI